MQQPHRPHQDQCERQHERPKSPSGWWRRVFVTVTVNLVCFSGMVAYVESEYLGSPGVVSRDDDDDRSRRLSVALAHGGCRVTYARLARRPIAQTWQASFPGSGSRVTWNLVEGLTGLRTNDDYDSHGRGYDKVVAVKTHYPVKYARRGPRGAKRGFHNLDPLFSRAMVVLRNPMNAVPSYFNLQYEHEHHLPNHSTRGPNRDWRKYRDDPNIGLAAQLVNYEKFVEYWMEKYDRSQLLLVSYEDMTDGMMGPQAAGRIAHFLGEVEGVNPIKPEAVTCVWETIVNFKNKQQPSDPEQKVLRGKVKVTHPDPGKSLRSGPKDRPYTAQNLADMLALFRRLQSKYSHDEEFVRIMQLYVDVAEKTVPRESSQQQKNPN